jgi:DNA mismatch repair protein MutS
MLLNPSYTVKFEIDKQTITDLELFERVKGEKSVFSFFNHTKSIGGTEKLKRMFSSPLVDIELLKKRIEIIKYFEAKPDFIDIHKEWLGFIEYYLVQGNRPARLSLIDIIRTAFDNRIKPTNHNYIIHRAITCMVKILNDLYEYASGIETDNCPEQLSEYKQTILELITNSELKDILLLKNKKRIRPIRKGKLDFYFRNSESEKIRILLDIIYEIDVYKSVSGVVGKYGFCYPTYTSTKVGINIIGLFHPFLEAPVSNDLNLADTKNLCFLTGPNMAGKSTYLKSFGISVYLAHLGFPVPANSMETSVFNGLLTTINLPDNINKGYSHYYSEVLRVKYVAEQINRLKNIVVIFDELFRGTNVIDAYEASLAVISAFAKIKMSLFAISTHIIEVADKLRPGDTIYFKFFEIKINDGIPQYTYKLKDGVTDERIGMYILTKEKVIETITKTISEN